MGRRNTKLEVYLQQSQKPGAPGAGFAPGGFASSTAEWPNLHRLEITFRRCPRSASQHFPSEHPPFL